MEIDKLKENLERIKNQCVKIKLAVEPPNDVTKSVKDIWRDSDSSDTSVRAIADSRLHHFKKLNTSERDIENNISWFKISL